MSTAPMTIETFLRVSPFLDPSISILLKGNHGIGKSQIARQLASTIRKSMKGSEFPVIDRRLSQVTSGDIIGLPSTDGEVTRFNPPDWYKKACNEPCFLFLDELNRAEPEVMQAAFQIVLDRELNGWKLHPMTRVMSAINSSASYTVNEVDPALLDRFWCVDLNATVEDWLKWAKSPPLDDDDVRNQAKMRSNVDSVVVDFIENENKWLDPAKNEEPSSVAPSRRSWDRLSMALVRAKLTDAYDDPSFYALCTGFVGLEATIAFVGYTKNSDARISAEDVLDRFEKVKSKLEKLGPEKQNVVIEKIADYMLNAQVKDMTEKQGQNLKKFTKMLGGELKLTMWSKLTAKGTERIDLARFVHKHIAEDILSVFDVPMGEAGIGVVPKIPGIFQDKDKTKK